MMNAAAYRRFGPPEVVRVEQVPKPRPAAGEVVVRVHASTVTAADSAARKGSPFLARLAFGPFRPRHPVLGDLAAGTVEAVGADVTGLSEGDAVVAVSGIAMGAHAEFIRVPAAGVVPKPASVDDADAVAVCEGGLTALPFLRDHGHVHAGQRVLVNGASGGIGTSAVQLATHLGAEVVGVCSTPNVELVRTLGAVEVVDYTRDDFTTARQAYDVVFDTVGTSSYGRCRAALKPGGVFLTGVPSVAAGLQSIWTRRLGAHRVVLGFTGLRPAAAKAADMTYLLDLAAEGAVRAVIDDRYPLAEIAEAHRRVDTGRKRGAAVVSVAAH